MHVNNDFQKNSNISHIFETVWRSKYMTRIDIANRLGLYRSTVSNVINTLLESELILEGEPKTETDRSGRKPIVLSVNENYGLVAGIEIQQDYYNVTVLSFTGDVILTFGGNTPYNPAFMNSPEETFVNIVDTIVSLIKDKIKDNSIPLLALSIGIPGIVNTDLGEVIYSEPFNLRKFNFAKELGNRYGIPLFMENDAKCCAWLQCGVRVEEAGRNFLCVLARNHVVMDKENKPYPVQNGIGIGLSMAVNGHIMNGHNYAFGEYVSKTWTVNKKGQTGLPEAVINTVTTVEDSYREWIKDLFSTLSILIPVLEPGAVFLHGQPSEKRDFIYSVIRDDVPEFDAVLQRADSRFMIMDDDDFEISSGAAFMFIEKLFEIPSVEAERSYSHMDWDELFEIRKNVLSNKM